MSVAHTSASGMCYEVVEAFALNTRSACSSSDLPVLREKSTLAFFACGQIIKTRLARLRVLCVQLCRRGVETPLALAQLLLE